ncbi:GNAT family N-acetyltransferase [Oceanicella sp. SM1341]|uniref:GNAT family N-acetyltransferase n=1 Tax=Oceanicella sp. SM1341 TaxID=1548889 RepID=UPI0018E54CEA|nr:GNAT family N-acetyltransferase [Oceanicella sp. SM1341]
MNTSVSGSFRSLMPWEGPVLLAHLERLPADDLRRRFCNLPAHDILEEYSAEPLRRDRQVIGWFRDGVLRGTAELRFGADDVEAALTVEPEFRCRGIGLMLLERARRRAQALGAKAIRIFTSQNNRPMIAVARKAGLNMSFEDGDAEGALALAPAPAAFWADLLGEEAGQIASILYWPAAFARAEAGRRTKPQRPDAAA